MTQHTVHVGMLKENHNNNNPCVSTTQHRHLVCLYSNGCCVGVRHEEKWCGDRMLTVQRRNVSFWLGAFLTDQLRHCSRALPAWLWIFGNTWLKRDKKALSSGHFRIIKAAGGMSVCVCVPSGGTLSNLPTINETVLCNSDVTYLTWCLHCPLQYSLWRGSL